MTNFNKTDCQARVEELPEYLREVLKRVACGQPTKQIADELGISESTVRVYRERLYSKLHANNMASATRIAMHAQLI